MIKSAQNLTAYENGISASAMGLILKKLNYSADEISHALYENYPLLMASELVSILLGSDIFPDLDRVQLISILEDTGYNNAQTLNAVTPVFPEIELSTDGSLSAAIGTRTSDVVLTYNTSGTIRWQIPINQAETFYNAPGGPSVSFIGEEPIFCIGEITAKDRQNYLGSYSEKLFPTQDDLKNQIANLLAYGLQEPYPPTSS